MLLIYKRTLRYIFIAFLFSTIIVIFPWEGLRNYQFIDLSINIMKVDFFEYYFNHNYDYKNIGFYISDEPFWYYINFLVNSLDIKGDVFFSFLAFLCFFIHCFYLLKEKVNPLYLLLYFNPLTLDFLLSQQRNAFCFSIFLILYNYKKIFKYFFIIMLPLIHSLSFVFILNLLFVDFTRKFKLADKKYILNILTIFLGFSISVFIAYGRYILQGYTEDARFGDYEVGVNSFLYLIPWLIYIFWFIVFSKEYTTNYILLILFLSVYIFLTFFDFYSVRFLAMSIPFLILNIYNLKYKEFFVSLFSMHQLILLYFWLKI